MTDRCQLNLRLDGRRDLLESCKEVAAAQGLSLNAWVIRQLELGVSGNAQPLTARQPLDNIVDTTRQPLDAMEVIEAPGKSDASELEEYEHALTTPEEALAHAKIFGFTPEEALADAHFQIAMLESNYDGLEDRYEAKKREIEKLAEQLADRDAVIAELRSELSDLKQNSATARELPDVYDVLNRLKAEDPKTKTTPNDIKKIYRMIEES